jgi:hypothetical protein
MKKLLLIVLPIFTIIILIFESPHLSYGQGYEYSIYNGQSNVIRNSKAVNTCIDNLSNNFVKHYPPTEYGLDIAISGNTFSDNGKTIYIYTIMISVGRLIDNSISASHMTTIADNGIIIRDYISRLRKENNILNFIVSTDNELYRNLRDDGYPSP